jgi:hypothetical protein
MWIDRQPTGATSPYFVDTTSYNIRPNVSIPGVIPTYGMYFSKLGRNSIFATKQIYWNCDSVPTHCPPNDPDPNKICRNSNGQPFSLSCLQAGGEGNWKCDYPCRLYVRYEKTNAAFIQHWSRHYYALWEPKYSGGVENLINFQEDWSRCDDGGVSRPCVFRFSGTLTAPWFSTEFKNEINNSSKTVYYYSPKYYLAPERKYDYNEDLRDNPPPGTPGTFSIKRISFNNKSEI